MMDDDDDVAEQRIVASALIATQSALQQLTETCRCMTGKFARDTEKSVLAGLNHDFNFRQTLETSLWKEHQSLPRSVDLTFWLNSSLDAHETDLLRLELGIVLPSCCVPLVLTALVGPEVLFAQQCERTLESLKSDIGETHRVYWQEERKQTNRKRSRSKSLTRSTVNVCLLASWQTTIHTLRGKLRCQYDCVSLRALAFCKKKFHNKAEHHMHRAIRYL